MVTVLPAMTPVARADVTCRSAVGYTWKGEPSGPEAKQEVRRFSGTAPTKEEALVALSAAVERGKAGAASECVATRHRLGVCVSRGFAAIAAGSSAAGFSARKRLEEAVVDDCKKDSGVCGVPYATEPDCVESAAPTASPEGEKGKEEKGKEEKGKKKK